MSENPRKQISSESGLKLQKILSKRLGRILTESELEDAYEALMDFAFALVDMHEITGLNNSSCKKEF